MSGIGSTFSESWHLVANLRVRLRPTVDVQRQFYRGEKWYVLQDPFNNRYFRIRPAAYEFVMRLDSEKTVEAAWNSCMASMAGDAPGQEEVVTLLGQLSAMNLLDSEASQDSRRIFERYASNRRRELISKLTNIMFIRLPLIDPQPLLDRFSRFTGLLVSPAGAVAWLASAAFALKLVMDNAGALIDGAQGLLASENLFLLYVGLVLVKAVHEFGHAAACRRFGGEVHTMGISLMLFTPLPYVDVTSSWGFRNRLQRMLVGAAGMLSELFIASIAAVYWAYSGEGVLHSLAYDIMFIASVSTVVFNINPLLRLDGYYMLSDLLDIPNLHAKAVEHLRYLLERVAFRCPQAIPVATNSHESVELALFGILSAVYKTIVFAGVIYFVADKWLILGTLMALAGVFSWGVLPVSRFISYLLHDPRLAQCQRRIIARSATAAAVLAVLILLIPFPHSVYAPGVVESYPDIKVVCRVSGHVRELLVVPGQQIVAGQPLAILENSDLRYAIRSAECKVSEMRVMERRALGARIVDIKPAAEELAAARVYLGQLIKSESELVVRATGNGIWVPATTEQMAGRWLERGTHIGDIVGGDRFRFAAVVNQDDASEVFAVHSRRVDVRLWGEASTVVRTGAVRLIPCEHETLPSAALGEPAGGSVAVNRQAGRGGGVNAAEPFFLVHAMLDKGSDALLLHGRSGYIRFQLNAEPLFMQWSRRIYQQFQKRYRL